MVRTTLSKIGEALFYVSLLVSALFTFGATIAAYFILRYTIFYALQDHEASKSKK